MITLQQTWRWLKVPENYFGAGLLVFALSFILLPTSKQVNNVYYLGLLLPAVIHLALNPSRLVPRSAEGALWLLFFVLACVAGLLGGGRGEFFKHAGYSLIFVLIATSLASPRLFSRPGFKRGAFWAVGAYIFVSSIVYWTTGTYAVGERILWLPGRMTGPIYTSMWLIACFALASSVWIQERRFIELAFALALSLFCVSFLLQSRSGFVGLAVLFLLLITGSNQWLGWRQRSTIVLLLAVGTGALWFSGYLDALVARGDALRFTIWRNFLTDWQECGIIRGCGLPHKEVFFTLDGTQLKAHSHNIYISLGVRLGLLPLLAFVGAQLLTLRRACRQGDSWGLYLAVSLVMLCFDGDLVIGNPDELWLLVWLPAALIANRNTSNESLHATY